MNEAPDRLLYMPKSLATMTFTGERLTSDVQGDITFEHWHRYMYAESLCAGKDVLDIASGEGYGSALLGQVAKSVVGVDIDESAIAHAQASYSSPSVTFRAGSATSIPADDQSFDLVTSFETLEHFFEHDEFLHEVKRVLRPGGTFIVSSPNTTIYSGPFQPINEFHRREVNFSEFTDLIQRFFAHHLVLGQMNVTGNLIVPVGSAPDKSELFNQHFDNRFGVYENGCPSTFYIFVGSDEPLNGLSVSTLNAAHHNATRCVEALNHQNLVASLRAEVDDLRSALSRERELTDDLRGIVRSAQQKPVSESSTAG